MRSIRLQVSLLAFAVVLPFLVAACGGSPSTLAPQPSGSTGRPTASEPGQTASSDAEWERIVARAKQEGSVTFYGSVVLQGARGAKIAQSFEQEYGLTVNVVGGSGSQVFQRVQQEIRNGVPSADIVNFYPPWQNTFEAAGYFQSIEGKPLPVLAEPASAWKVKPSALKPSLTYLTMRTTYGYPITVNKRLLSPADYPTSFHQMATDPKYYGKIGWVDPHTTQDPAFKWVGFGYVAKAMSLEDVWRIYTQQKPVLYEAPQSETGPLARGEVALIMGGGGAGADAAQGAPVESVSFPDVPVVTTPSIMGMVKDAPHPNAALVFINWVFSKEGQSVIATVGANPSTRTDVPDGVPQVVAEGVVSGGGKPGPQYLYSAMQSQLAADVYKDANGAWIGLTSGISLNDFTNTINEYVKRWEAQHGDQSQPLLAE